jgi:hypothetical protein
LYKSTIFIVLSMNKKESFAKLWTVCYLLYDVREYDSQSSGPRPVKFLQTSKFFSFYLELYKNKFNNLIWTSKFKFSFWGLDRDKMWHKKETEIESYCLQKIDIPKIKQYHCKILQSKIVSRPYLSLIYVATVNIHL